jgi:hypothetical protein
MPVATIIPFQPPLPQVLPTIEGNVDYRQLREQLLRIQALLLQSGLETQFLEKDLQRWLGQRKKASAKAQQTHQLHSQRALRCNIARLLLRENYRTFAARLADSPLLQHFCGLSQIDVIQVPSKSTLQRYDLGWPEAEVRALIAQLLNLGATAAERLHLRQPLDLESAFLDTTCLKANIHYPVDWVLLRDATRTLIKAVTLIRAQGLKHRMEAPETFLTRINTLCIQMTHAGNRKDVAQSRRQRKQTLRQMDRLVGTVRNHARRYRQLLDQQWPQTQWTRPQAEQILRRMDQILEQLPQARKQARQRILKEQPVANAEKILSLYEPEVLLAAQHCHHVHARVGYEEGPQVSTRVRRVVQPSGCPREVVGYNLALATAAWVGGKHANARVRPAPYLHMLPFTQVPVANLADICDWQARRQADGFQFKLLLLHSRAKSTGRSRRSNRELTSSSLPINVYPKGR